MKRAMFKNKAENQRLNLAGTAIRELRLEMGISQRALADRVQLRGVDISKNAVQRMESGQRFITDIELRAFADVLGVSADVLLR